MTEFVTIGILSDLFRSMGISFSSGNTVTPDIGQLLQTVFFIDLPVKSATYIVMISVFSRLLPLLIAVFALLSPSLLPVRASEEQSVRAAEELVQRFTPRVGNLVRFELTGNNDDNITISKHGDGIQISAKDTRRLVAGYGWYLRNIARVHFSWNGNRLDIPIPMPAPEQPLSIREPWLINFAFNYCTLSYTAAFWDWERWQREIDFLALNGFTHALVTAGLEHAWQEFLKGLGYPDDRIGGFIPNPAYAAWWNMGNLEGFGGPLSQAQIDRERELGQRIVARMKSLGMTPVLQGYVGFIPADFTSVINIPGLSVVEQGQWVGFKRPWVVDPTCAAFPDLAKRWYHALEQTYGTTTTAYGGDLFHEGGKKGNINVTEAAKAVQAAMQQAVPGSTWVLQSWHANPTRELLLGTDPEHTLVLRLTKMADGNNHLRRYEGRPWVWCELSNFGGNTGMYGGLPLLARLGADLKQYDGKELVGMGILSEGVETNPLHYELFFDRLWTKDNINLDEWLAQYAQKRYGSAPQPVVDALGILARSIYSPKRSQDGFTESIICARPGWNVTKASTWSSSSRYYRLSDVAKAASLYGRALQLDPSLSDRETFRYDLIDVTRQLLADSAFFQLQVLRDAFDRKDVEDFKKQKAVFLKLITDMDELLACHPQFRLDSWIDRARAKGTTEGEKRLMEQNARRLITTWIDRVPQPLNDYSNRQWAGLLKEFYLFRWKTFLDCQLDILEGGKADAANDAFRKTVFSHELAYPETTSQSPRQAKPGDCGAIAAGILNRLNRDILPALIALDRESEGMAWNLKDGSPFQVNVTDLVTSAGEYAVTFQWKKGQSALKIHSVTLYEGDREVARDAHEGWTGIENRDNTYKLSLPHYRTSLDSYTLKADVSGASGNDSSGTIRFNKVK